MSKNEIMIRKPSSLAVLKDESILLDKIPNIKYSLVDTTHYVFEYKINDDIDMNMFESDRVFDGNDFVDADFDDSISERDYSYYTVAVASGIITGSFSQLKIAEDDIERIKSWKEKDWNKYVTIAAQIAGYKKSDIKGATEFLKTKMIPFIDEEIKREFQDSIDEWLEQLSNHPSLAGLLFSVFSQFSGERYRFGEKGIEKESFPDYYAIGRNTSEKLVYGFLYWVFALSFEIALSKGNRLEEMKIPKEIINMLRNLFKLPLFRNIQSDFIKAERLYSEWIKSLFENSEYRDDDGSTISFDLYGEIESLAKAFKDSTPVLINECVVRAFYLIKKLSVEIKENEICSYDDLIKIEKEKIIPFNNRLVSRMVLISSGCFVGVNIAEATLNAIIKENKDGKGFAKTLFSEISIAGVGRFVFACVADSKYWADDIKVFLQRKDRNKKVDETVEEERIVNEFISNENFKIFSLTPAQTRALYSLESIAVKNDIERTKNADDRRIKQLWLETWQNRILAGMELNLNNYFVDDEKLIYSAFNSIDQTTENLHWFYLLTLELVVFKPFYPLGDPADKEFVKVKRGEYNYIDDQFARRQTIVNQKEIESIRSAYKKYKGIISGNTQNTIIVAGVAAVAAVATGGLAFAFAPGIATLIAGEAVIGRHGAALTSASLAFVGGGAIASGGLGMAGGTAIITGGGALLGIAGTGSASMAAILTQTSSEYWIRQTTKMISFCKCVLKDRLNDIDSLKALSEEIRITIKKVEKNITELEDEKCSLDKTAIRNSKDCLKYLNKCSNEIDKLTK